MLLDLRSLVEPSGPAAYVYAGAGGIAFAGSSTTARGFSYVATGGITFGGTKTEKVTFAPAVGGGITFGGAATLKKAFSVVATGGITFGGAAAVSRSSAAAATGGITFGGADTVQATHAYAASGGIAFGGVAPVARAFTFAASSGIVFGGAGTTSLLSSVNSYRYLGIGGIDFGGQADPPGITFVYTAAGGLLLGGAAETSPPQSGASRDWTVPVVNYAAPGGRRRYRVEYRAEGRGRLPLPAGRALARFEPAIVAPAIRQRPNPVVVHLAAVAAAANLPKPAGGAVVAFSRTLTAPAGAWRQGWTGAAAVAYVDGLAWVREEDDRLLFELLEEVA